MSELRTATLSNLAGTGPATLTGQSAAKAWSYFNQTSHTILASFNIASVIDSAVGQTVVNMTSAMSSVNWSVSVTGTGANTNAGYAVTDSGGFNGVGTLPYRTTTTFNVRAVNGGTGSADDHEDVNTAAYGDLA